MDACKTCREAERNEPKTQTKPSLLMVAHSDKLSKSANADPRLAEPPLDVSRPLLASA